MIIATIITGFFAICSLIWNYLNQKKLEKSLLIHRIQFEKEFEVYKEVWGKIIDLKVSLWELLAVIKVGNDRPIKENENEDLKKAMSSYNQFFYIVEKNRPFYPEEIYKPLFEICNISRKEAFDFIFKREPGKISDWYQGAENSKKQFTELMDNVCTSIRRRINQ